MYIEVGCLLFVVCGLLFIVCCSLLVFVCCLLFIVCISFHIAHVPPILLSKFVGAVMLPHTRHEI